MQRPLPERPATFQRESSGSLSVGAAEADITPDGVVYMGGFDIARTSTGIHERLKVRALVFKVGIVKLAIVGVDNLGLQRDDVEWVKSGLAGFENGCVLLCSSHTHAAPDLVGMWGFYFMTSGRDPEYLALVRRRIAEAVAAADANARPAALSRSEARLPPDGLVRNSNRGGVFDRRLTVLQATATDSGEPIGALLHMACHPEALRRANTLISPDFVGPLCDRWKAAGHGQAVFVNGALGAMISPEPNGVEALADMAEQLFVLAESSLEHAVPVPVEYLHVRRRDVYLPMESLGLNLGRVTMVIPREVYDGHLRTTVGYLRLGTFEACLLPGETEPGLAARIFRASRRTDMVLFGLVDDEVGYLMSEKDARDPEYEYERSMSPGPEAGEQVLRALVGR